MGFQLRDTLRRLSEEIGWSYAVFWRAIDDRSPMHLVWEDGHWHHGAMSNEVELLVNKIMATQAHVFGDGIVGQAASRGSHIWILRDRMNVVGLGSKDLAELNHQFLAGIQTIAVIPVLPLGVLQLGSSQMVMENIGFVNSVKNFFGQLGCARALLPGIVETASVHSNRPYNKLPAVASAVLPDKFATKTKSATLKGSVDSVIHSVDKFFNQRYYLKTTQGVSVDIYPVYSSNSSQSVLTAGKQKQEKELSQDYDVPPTEFDVNDPCSQAVFSTKESKFSGSNIAQESQIFYNAVCDANGMARQIKRNIKDGDKNLTDSDISKLHSMFPAQRTLGDDLYDVLHPDYKVDNSSLNDALLHIGDGSVDGLVTHTSTCLPQLVACPISYSMIDGTSGPGMFSGDDTDQLLEAVVSNINFGVKHSTNDNCYSQTSENKIGGSSLPDVSTNYKLVASSKELQGEPFGVSHVLGKADATASSSVISSSSLGNITEECLPSIGACKSQINLWAESGQDMKCDNLLGTQGKRVDENSKLNKKRSRPGENPRPRPKDRQLIMDRVKELREIIPNGAKLSIDALLEKTIKHMIFLQSVTKHAEKLKDIGEPKFINREGGLQLKENFKGGATWAYEVGTQSTACPIIVEDLNPPRQMLVEMLCEQRGFFLEIADFIRGLGLTILKGVMEVRKDKIWARFAVEANRDVTRVEIFLSLVSLLEPSFGSSSTPQGVNKLNSLHNVYNRSCIPASGLSDHLQRRC
ncbi:transcription factor LHW-like [Iris pallida]|uniref:Transcription factor LHW-like n=1 Tax=Iris pallida TaxID=29817 RepID=A0AAX6H312_IRIPA|nr:transcription factor LHW-like [Iris pallida]